MYTVCLLNSGKLSFLERTCTADQQIYPYSMPKGLIILMAVMETLIIGNGFTDFLYCKCKHTVNCSKTSSISQHKDNLKDTVTMLPSSSQQLITPPKVKVSHEKVGEISELLGIDFCNFDKYKACRNSKD